MFSRQTKLIFTDKNLMFDDAKNEVKFLPRSHVTCYITVPARPTITHCKHSVLVLFSIGMLGHQFLSHAHRIRDWKDFLYEYEMKLWCDCGPPLSPSLCRDKDPFHERFMNLYTKSFKNICCSDMKNNNLIRSQFCTCHDSWAVMVCAKLWPDWIIEIKIRVTRTFKRF